VEESKVMARLSRFMPSRHREEVKVLLYPYLTLAQKGVGGQCHILVALSQERDLAPIIWEAGW
jgi:hypothetical protein